MDELRRVASEEVCERYDMWSFELSCWSSELVTFDLSKRFHMTITGHSLLSMKTAQ